MIVYYAAPLFTLAEIEFNSNLVERMNKISNIEFIVPQERSHLFSSKKDMAKDCFRQIDKCDLVLACMDGPDADSGTCVELGYAIAKNKKTICFRTDFRQGEENGANIMIVYGCTEYLLLNSLDYDLDMIAKTLVYSMTGMTIPNAMFV